MEDIVPNDGAAPQDPEASTPKLDFARLTIMPRGINLYRDLERSRDFLTLHFSREKVGPGTAKGFEAAVRADLAQAGIPVGNGGKAEVTPHSKAPRFFNCFVQVPVQLVEGGDPLRCYEEICAGCKKQ